MNVSERNEMTLEFLREIHANTYTDEQRTQYD